MAINLLPEEQKEIIRAEYRRRVTTAFGWLVTLVILTNIVLLAPAWFAFSAQERELGRQLDAIEQGALYGRVTEIEASIRTLNRQIRQYQSEDRGAARAIPAFDAALSARPAGVAITTASFAAGAKMADRKARLTIAGNAASRASLLVFFDRLKTRPGIESVESPISNLLRETDVDYQITAVLRP
ncbi:MAG: hypothetical protein HYS44_04050 [Candidatus Niyogibacteria bacterium]|nr:hypothetical protein [Candidatus Niyogibacteria bacterium]